MLSKYDAIDEQSTPNTVHSLSPSLAYLHCFVYSCGIMYSYAPLPLSICLSHSPAHRRNRQLQEKSANFISEPLAFRRLLLRNSPSIRTILEPLPLTSSSSLYPLHLSLDFLITPLNRVIGTACVSLPQIQLAIHFPSIRATVRYIRWIYC